jgi:DivIVA domain-containing protein
VEIDRQAIERRDFPISRRGYDPASVDAHLRTLAGEIEELQRERVEGGVEPSLAATAGSQVQSIVAAAEAAAADIEREALAAARTLREDAGRDAARTREEAIAHARAHVAAVTQAAAALLEQVGKMDHEVGGLIEGLREGANRLNGDLAGLDASMGELYDAASGRGDASADVRTDAPLQDDASAGAAAATAAALPPPSTGAPAGSAPPAASARPASASSSLRASRLSSASARSRTVTRAPSPQPVRPAAPASAREAQAPVESGDLDGARLVALNMALNGESRANTDRYLAENFELVDREKLIAEVYAAIAG